MNTYNASFHIFLYATLFLWKKVYSINEKCRLRQYKTKPEGGAEEAKNTHGGRRFYTHMKKKEGVCGDGWLRE